MLNTQKERTKAVSELATATCVAEVVAKDVVYFNA